MACRGAQHRARRAPHAGRARRRDPRRVGRRHDGRRGRRQQHGPRRPAPAGRGLVVRTGVRGSAGAHLRRGGRAPRRAARHRAAARGQGRVGRGGRPSAHRADRPGRAHRPRGRAELLAPDGGGAAPRRPRSASRPARGGVGRGPPRPVRGARRRRVQPARSRAARPARPRDRAPRGRAPGDGLDARRAGAVGARDGRGCRRGDHRPSGPARRLARGPPRRSPRRRDDRRAQASSSC